ncbi:hypothetical protein [Streptomyces sp. B6B3]|uniref:hypothetical protein n=1 Tax=Streptomyces sp. B6B3 TaxID=3153570 RepID=UPI00325EABEA
MVRRISVMVGAMLLALLGASGSAAALQPLNGGEPSGWLPDYPLSIGPAPHD